ncbi:MULTISPECIES: T6SS phospholipase effector Tle1-like catalytic domain-containing protein [Dyella]|uniref:DUF2235 domain-containing protein n=2 Tax=Dyella TaxID=231454 RepID=A0A4R0YL41_9GAMM|nr:MULTISPECIES: DUF2235 domain-containing protein [Dyella]TBR36741.1 DUF2235 domain-containing protein [Dyella terrae]TCI08168.1 DUF2235 domain-containing protein [Dyella soli]
MNKEAHEIAKDGIRKDGVSHYEATSDQLASFENAHNSLRSFYTPRLMSSESSRQRIFIAAFDGTGNDALNDPTHKTNVGNISAEIDAISDPRIATSYLRGPGTQEDVASRLWDGATGYTHDRRAEDMYKSFTDQAREWLEEDPRADISVVAIGFSRGAEIAAQFTRIVDERGIQNPDGAEYVVGSDKLVRRAVHSLPPLVAPGEVPQAVGLFDPVNTGRPEDRDRRLPPSVVSGFQIIAGDERRNKFKSDHIIDPGLSPDGRFLGVTVAGAHSDIGGSYHRNGLSVRSGHLMKDYLNSLSDQPFLQKKLEPDNPGLNVVHRSEEGMLLYRLDRKVDRQSPEGQNKLLVPMSQRNKVDNPYDAEPRDEAIHNRFEHHPVRSGARTQGLHESAPHGITKHSSSKSMFEAYVDAKLRGDDAACREIAHAYSETPKGQAFLAKGRELFQQEQAIEKQQEQSLGCQSPAERAPAQRAPSMRR